ncbi:hypothetical protein EC845_0519 [Comamonas sp. BIGb0124]|nr:hypothetical protein EC845_0519 [Comamonas sp. BIGb0124]
MKSTGWGRGLAVASVLAVLLLTGCATRTKMTFEDPAESVTAASKPVFLMTATIKNPYKTRYQPKLNVLHVEKPGATEAADRWNFVVDDKARQETNSSTRGNHYLLRMSLDPGSYELVGFSALASAFPVHGLFFVPLYANLKVTAPGVYYLGHVEATVRERQGEEFRAGPLIPLIDQAIAGASGGTFDIVITDQQAKDEAAFRSYFPALANVPIIKAMLPSFDRIKAQKRWDAQ